MSTRRTAALAAFGVVTGLGFVAPSHAQVPECQVLGSWAGWGTNGTGMFDVSQGQACTIGVTTFGRIEKTRVARIAAEHGKVTQLNSSSFEYRPSPGFTGADTFVLEGTGHDPSEPPGQASAVTMTVNVR